MGIHAVRRADIEQGSTVAVFGAGTVGLLTAAMAKLSGATTVVIADIDSGRVSYAVRNGFATKGFVVTPGRFVHETSDKLESAKALGSAMIENAREGEADFEGVDVSFDCTGKELCVQAGLYVSVCSLI